MSGLLAALDVTSWCGPGNSVTVPDDAKKKKKKDKDGEEKEDGDNEKAEKKKKKKEKKEKKKKKNKDGSSSDNESGDEDKKKKKKKKSKKDGSDNEEEGDGKASKKPPSFKDSGLDDAKLKEQKNRAAQNNEDAISAISEGHIAILYTLKDTESTDKLDHKFVTVKVIDNTIKYVAEGSKAKEGIPVASAKITAGRSGAVFKSSFLKDVDEDTLVQFSDDKGDVNFNMQLISANAVTTWKNAITALTSRSRSSSAATKRSDSVRRADSVSNQKEGNESDTGGATPSASKYDLEQVIDMMKKGSKFTQYTHVEEDDAVPQEIIAYYDEQPAEKAGRIYWALDSKKKKDEELDSIGLKEIGNIILGNKSPIDKVVSKSDSSKNYAVFSIIAKKEVNKTLHLKSDDKGMVKKWLHGIRALLEKAGKKFTAPAGGAK